MKFHYSKRSLFVFTENDLSSSSTTESDDPDFWLRDLQVVSPHRGNRRAIRSPRTPRGSRAVHRSTRGSASSSGTRSQNASRTRSSQARGINRIGGRTSGEARPSTSKNTFPGISTSTSSSRSTLCFVCFINLKVYLLYPCKHFGLCEDCKIEIERTKLCPTCRQPIIEFLKPFHVAVGDSD